MSSVNRTDRSGHQDILINVLKKIASEADAYWWHFNGDNDADYDESSLSHLLGIDHDEMVLIMEKCGYMDEEKKLIRSSWISLSTGSAKDLVNGQNSELRKNRMVVRKDSTSLRSVSKIIHIQSQLQSISSRKDLSSSFPHEETVLGNNYC